MKTTKESNTTINERINLDKDITRKILDILDVIKAIIIAFGIIGFIYAIYLFGQLTH